MIGKITACLTLALALCSGAPQGSYSGGGQPTHLPNRQQFAYAAQGPVTVGSLPVAKVAGAVAADPQYDPNPQYNYGYSISDVLTGDQHGHQESRSNGVVQGQYSLVEPDGSTRTVTYTADPVNGFNAVVDRSAPQVSVAKVHAAPVAYAAGPAFAKVH